VARLVALGVGALALCCLVAACGGGKSTARRDAVATYILRVDAIEQRLAKPLLDVSKANRDFAKGRGASPAARRELVRAQATIARLQRTLRGVKPPPDAAKLHALVLQFVAREQALGGEVVQLARFIPAFTGTLTLLAAPNADLKRILGQKGTTLPARAAALERYRAALDPVLAKLRRLDPPPSSRPVWAQQIRTLEGVQAAVAALADALAGKHYAAIPALLHRLNTAAVTNQSVAAQKAQIAAVKGYNARIGALNALGSRISSETARLQRTLG
jgi:hypothetical protein